MSEDRRTPGRVGSAQPTADARIEDLTRQIAQIINGAGAEQRQDLREYALGLIKEETEVVEAPPVQSPGAKRADSGALGMALLLGLIAVPMTLLFAPIGLAILALAAVLGVTGVVQVLVRR